MEPGPMSGGIKIRPRLFIFSLIYVIFVGTIFYLLTIFVDSFTAFAVLFLILLNTYWIYRGQIRNKLAGTKESENDYQESSIKEKDGHEVLSNLKNEYLVCPHCGSSIIPGLDYCEECGNELNG